LNVAAVDHEIGVLDEGVLEDVVGVGAEAGVGVADGEEGEVVTRVAGGAKAALGAGSAPRAYV
jgi:hypothetical protein